MMNLGVLGSTGSVGKQALDVLRKNPDRFCVKALACLKRIDILEAQAREFHPEMVAVYDASAAKELETKLADTDIKVVAGMEGLLAVVEWPGIDRILMAIVGMISILPTVTAILAGRDIALASKEALVTAGHVIIPLAKEHGVQILPVDSEHSAIFQSLQGNEGSEIRRILLTGSGGPFRDKTREELEHVTVEDALAHPTWHMGPKITIDSATLVNKGLELIEAVRLFDVAHSQVEILTQPQSIVHSAIEYADGSVIAQIGPRDMRIPIQFALTHPLHLPSPAAPLDFTKGMQLELFRPDHSVLKGIALADRAIEAGGSMTTVFNAANEWANAAFRAGRISFLQIYDCISEEMDRHDVQENPSIEEILALQKEIDCNLEERMPC